MDRIRKDTNNDCPALRSAQRKVQAMETCMGDLEDLVRRQGLALNAMESRLCKCGGSRWAEDLQRTPVLVSSSLSYTTPPVVEVVLESPEPLPVPEPAGITEEEVLAIVASPASQRLILRVRRKHIRKQAEPYPRMALGS